MWQNNVYFIMKTKTILGGGVLSTVSSAPKEEFYTDDFS